MAEGIATRASPDDLFAAYASLSQILATVVSTMARTIMSLILAVSSITAAFS